MPPFGGIGISMTTKQIIIKNQDLTQEFCSSPDIINSLLYISNFDRFCLYQHTKGAFRLMSEREMERMVYFWLRDVTTKNLTMGVTKDVVDQTRFECHRQHKNFNSPYISFEDKLFNTTTNQFEDFDIQKISFISIPIHSRQYENLPTEAPPVFKKFLEFILVDKHLAPETDLIGLVQEMFGYCLMPDTTAEASFFLVGEGANGKSKLIDVLRSIIGEQQCGSSSIETLSNDQFELSSLIGKRLNVCTEESSEFVKQDKFKILVSGEPISIRGMYKTAFSERLPIKFIFATNEMPSFTGYNTAFMRRIKIIPFHRIIKAHERDINIANKVLKERNQIFLWALAGMKRLIAQGMQFTETPESIAKSKELTLAMSSAIEYIDESYDEEEGAFMPNSVIYYDYKEVWCRAVGKKPVSRDRFFKEITRYHKFESKLGRNSEGKVERGRQLVLKDMEAGLKPEDILGNIEMAQRQF